MDKYETTALGIAHERKYTAAEVQEKDYVGIAEMCGVKIGSKGESPKDFFYQNVRNVVAQELHAEEDEVVKVKRQRALEAHIAADPDLQGLEIEAETKDRMLVRKPKLEAE